MTSHDKFAVLGGKLAARAIRAIGAGLGSNLPGRLARKISPAVLASLAAQAKSGVIAVTGTNGKSTTSGILASILRTAGLEIVHNLQGANLVTGITACLVDASTWDGKIEADYCLFEIDEAAFPLVAAETAIHTVVVTNLFRDQLDRFGELDTTAKLISKGIRIKNSTVVLNADDPNVSQLEEDAQRVYFGIESLGARSEADSEGQPKMLNAELAYCAKCGAEVRYEQVFYGQLGRWSCSKCDNKRPHPSVRASEVHLHREHSQFKLSIDPDVVLQIELPLPGLFNIYNALAAAAAATKIDITHEAIRHGIKDYRTLFGRSEKVVIDGKKMIIQLIKNPAGTSQAVSSVVADTNSIVLIAINDNLADGRDISWLWDADFEPLGKLNRPVIVSGQRAEDMAVRMKYAGTSADNITCIPSLSNALDKALEKTGTDQMLWILPTYTCLLDLQKILKARGLHLSGT
jgi:UDP-N-acetylmuramyl tripeptide synthase